MNSTSLESLSANALRRRFGAGVIGAIYLALLLVSLSVFIAGPGYAAEPNLLLNGDLSKGSTDRPDHWIRAPFASQKLFKWSRPAGEPASLEVERVKGLFRHTSYWSQTVNLAQPGWYHLRAEVKTDDADTSAAIKVEGAHETEVVTQSNQQWAPMEAYFKVAGPEAVQIGCGVRATPAGHAFFRNLSLYRISGAPPSGSRQFDLTHHSQIGHDERAALVNVELAKSTPDESLLRDVLNPPAVAAILILLAMLTFLDRRYATHSPAEDARGGFLQDPEVRKSVGIATLLCLTLLGTWLVTRVEYVPGHGFYVVEPHAVGGDEPHYLVMTNSLLYQHNLRVLPLYDDVDQGGPEAGVLARGIKLDRQTVRVNRRTGDRILEKDWDRRADSEFVRSPDVYEIPMHPAGFPLFLALAIAPMQPRARQVEPDVGFILMLIAWLGVVATYFVGRQVGMSRGWAMLAASILFAASPWLAYSRAYFAESAIGTTLILGLWALMADLPIVAALAAAAGTTMKAPFALVGAGFFVEEVREKRWKSALKIALILGLPALEIFAYNFWLHRSALTLGVQWSFHPYELWRTFLSPTGGLLRYAPWTIFGFLACARALPSQSSEARLARTMGLPLFLYLLVLCSIGFGGGYCFGPRYWIAFLPWLALGTVEALRTAGRYQRSICVALVLFAIALAIPDALRYPQLFRKPAVDVWQSFH